MGWNGQFDKLQASAGGWVNSAVDVVAFLFLFFSSSYVRKHTCWAGRPRANSNGVYIMTIVVCVIAHLFVRCSDVLDWSMTLTGSIAPSVHHST